MIETTTETYSGRFVDLAHPDPKTICIEDIAWHLSRIARFGGATTSASVYTVAQHSVLVLNRVRQQNPLAETMILLHALLHDAHEAYTGDIIRPISRLLDMRGPVDRLKSRMQRVIWDSLFNEMLFSGRKFIVTGGDEVSAADDWALSYEAYHFMHSRGQGYANRQILAEEYITRNVIVWDHEQARQHFLNHYRDLTS